MTAQQRQQTVRNRPQRTLNVQSSGAPPKNGIPPIPRDQAEALLAAWTQARKLDGIAIGMSRDEVIAACSLSDNGAGPREPIAERMGPISSGPPPYLAAIECGPFGNSIVAGFAPPPAKPLVMTVTRHLTDYAANGQFGTPDAFLRRLQAEYGPPDKEVTEGNASSHTAHYAWVFRRSPSEIPCVVAVPGQQGGFTLEFGIPAGGPCATHLQVLISPRDRFIDTARLSLSNPDFVAAALDAYIDPLNLPDTPRHPIYREYAENARKANLTTREERENIAIAGAVLLLLAKGVSATGAANVSNDQMQPGASGRHTEQDSYSSYADRHAACLNRCDRYCPGAHGMGAEWDSSQAEYNQCQNEIGTCRTSCP